MEDKNEGVYLYKDEELLMLSGIQHYYFCKRQWMMIHIEHQWADNIFTFKGNQLHEKVDNPLIMESRKSYFVSRSIPICSYELGFYGISDAVEFHKSKDGCYIPQRNERFKIIPVEYKVGKPKEDACDAVQLCVQGIGLEEMLNCKIDYGYLFYGKTRKREKVVFDLELRELVKSLAKEMHELILKDALIKAKYTKKCEHCSLYNQCLPKVNKGYKTTARYIYEMLKGGEED